jgi:hypothetical protein
MPRGKEHVTPSEKSGRGTQVDGQKSDEENSSADRLLVYIKPPNRQTFALSIQGERLVVHSKRGYLEELRILNVLPRNEDLKKALQRLMPNKPSAEQQYADSRYPIDENTDGFPTRGVKKAIVRAIQHTEASMPMTRLGVLFAVNPGEDLVPIICPAGPRMREDIIGQGGARKSPGLRYRAEYVPWRLDLRIQHDADRIGRQTLLDLISIAGDKVGIGESRPEKSGDWGRFVIG